MSHTRPRTTSTRAGPARARRLFRSCLTKRWIYTYADTDCVTNANSNTHGHSYTYSDRYADKYAYSYAETDANAAFSTNAQGSPHTGAEAVNLRKADPLSPTLRRVGNRWVVAGPGSAHGARAVFDASAECTKTHPRRESVARARATRYVGHANPSFRAQERVRSQEIRGFDFCRNILVICG
jgi:hypothetical protein